MKKIKVTYKNDKRTSDTFTCERWGITDRNCLLKFYTAGLCVGFVRLPEVLKVVIN